MSNRNKHNVLKKTAEISSNPWTLQIGLSFIVIIQFVCPLLFFTGLTRNPYYTQIALLNIGIVICGVLWALECFRTKSLIFPRTPFEIPLLVFLFVCLGSTILAWMGHSNLRVGIQNEALRIWTFTLVNSVMAFYLPLIFTSPIHKEAKPISIWGDIIFAVVWGSMWFGFHEMKNSDPLNLIWDPYGGFLWIIGSLYAFFRVRKGSALGVYHVVFSVCLIAGGYGLMQYMGTDIIWNSPIQPYGGRPVSTFGNPNFLSSYLMILSPLAIAFGVKSKGAQRWGYFFVAAVCILSALGTLTRSTYVGLAASMAALVIIFYRGDYKTLLKWSLITAAVIGILILVFPTTPVTGSQSPFARFKEIYMAIQSGRPYGPWHQRLMIWNSAWDMVQERPLFGKGWGCFELFYPYYQGQYLLTRLFAGFRTHANNAHNVLFEVWSQIGFLGVGTAIWSVFVMILGGWKIFVKKSEGMSKALMAGSLACFVGMMTDNFFGNVSIFFAVPAFMFWWNMGALYNESNIPVVKRYELKHLGRLALILFIVFCLAVVVYFVKRWKQEVYYFKGFRESKMGLVPESIKSLEKAYDWFEAEVNSNYELGNSYSRYSKILEDKKLFREAKKYKEKSLWAYQKSVEANPGYDEIYFNLGITHSQLGDTDGAILKIRTALFINPLLRDAYASLGNMYIQKANVFGKGGDKENKKVFLGKAAEAYRLGAETFPQDKDLILNLGYVYSEMGDHQRAFDTYKKIYKADPTYQQAWNNLRLAAAALGVNEPLIEVPSIMDQIQKRLVALDYKGALALVNQLEKIIPDYAHVYLTKGQILFNLNKPDLALESLEKALALDPSLDEARFNLGQIYQNTNRPDDARFQYQKILERGENASRAQTAIQSLPHK